jgi:hypothetical protein
MHGVVQCSREYTRSFVHSSVLSNKETRLMFTFVCLHPEHGCKPLTTEVALLALTVRDLILTTAP